MQSPAANIAPLAPVKRAGEDARQSCWRAQATIAAPGATTDAVVVRLAAAAADLAHMRAAVSANQEGLKNWVPLPVAVPARDPQDSKCE
jgi:hypothetical protein